MTDPASYKAALRAEAAAARARAFAANPLAGETLAGLFPASLVQPGMVVAGYAPFRTEIDPRPLMRRLERLGARLALPVTPATGKDEPLSFRLLDPTRGLAAGRYGIPEPDAACRACAPDLLLVPLLAFDRRGGRLGYGAGWYDRTLVSLRASKPVVAVGLGFAVQEIPRVPTGPQDGALDDVCTERAFTRISD
jgi:5-formyltetrahydrofolate cyclo-ligase